MKQTPKDFFTPLGNTRPFVKAAFQGFAGSGKTYTAALMAIGIHKLIKSEKPIVFYDTERAMKALKPTFDAAKIEALVKESRTLADLQKTIDYCEGGAADILVIDSITHVWESYLSAYKAQKRRTALYFQDWGIIKPEWKKRFSDRYVTANVHIIFTGRAGFDYDQVENEKGKIELFKSGIKMKAENETAYEPDLLVLMERHEDVLEKKKHIWREAVIIKDRTTLIDGKVFQNPSFKDFKPVIKQMLDGVAADMDDETPDDFTDYEGRMEENSKRKTIVLEKVKALFESLALGTSKEDKKLKVDLTERAFGTTSGTEIKNMSAEELEDGYLILDLFADGWRDYINTTLDNSGTPVLSAAYDIMENMKMHQELFTDDAKEAKG